MKKYKLIKKYPGSKEIGTMVKAIHSEAGLNTRYTDMIGREYGWHEVEDYPEYWKEIKEPTFKVGDWVSKLQENIVYRIEEFDEEGWANGDTPGGGWHPNRLRLATTEEIENHLIAEAKKRGFAKGVSYRYPDRPDLGIRKVESNEFGYNAEYDSFYDKGFHNYNLYRGGQWAEIVKEEEIKIGGYNTSFDYDQNMFYVGCRRFTFASIKSLYQNMCYFGISMVRVSDIDIEARTVKLILDRAEKQ